METIKALTLWQPWASLILLGHKCFETRSWHTKYRGQLIIHAAKKQGERLQTKTAFILYNHHKIDIPYEDLPRGVALLTCNLTDCIPITPRERDRQTQLELDCGDWRTGRWAWKLENIEAIEPPIPMTGHQGLWNVSPFFYQQIVKKCHKQQQEQPK